MSMSFETYLYRYSKSGNLIPGKLVTIDDDNFVDGETPLEDYAPFFTYPVLMDDAKADAFFMKILESYDNGDEPDMDSIFLSLDDA